MKREWNLKVIMLIILPSLGWASDEFCSKEKGFDYRPNVQYQNNLPLSSCYITKEQFISKQAIPGFILADLRSVNNQSSILITPAVSYSVVALKSLLAKRKLEKTSFVIPSNLSKIEIVKGLNTMLVKSMDLDSFVESLTPSIDSRKIIQSGC